MSRLLKLGFIFGVLLPLSTNALFFHMRHSEERCFFEEIPSDTLIRVNYKAESWNPGNKSVIAVPNNGSSISDVVGIGLKFSVKDDRGEVLMSKTYGMEGRFVLTSHSDGGHIICLSSNDTSLEDFLRVHLNIEVGGHAVDYEIVKKKEKLTALQLQLRKILDLSSQISKEQNYQRSRETRFRETSESTNSRVLWFAMIQTVLLITVGIYQIRHLKMFFIIKKLV